MVVPIGPSDIGTAGLPGFGVGVSLPALPAGYTYLGGNDRAGPDFGRYLNASSQPETGVPACWLRIGSTESPRYAAFGIDAVDVLPLRAYYNLPDAAADGYFLHPALDVNKQVQSGFFRAASLTANQLDYVETLYTAALQVNPLILFSNGEQGAWYDPSDLSTLFQDSAGTTPVTADGQPVGLALDKSGNGNHASQATATARQLYRTDGARHWLEFDGVDDSLVIASYPVIVAGKHSAGISGRNTGVGLQMYLDSDSYVGGSRLTQNLRTQSLVPESISFVGTEDFNDPGPATVANTDVVLTQVSASTVEVFNNGVSNGPTTPTGTLNSGGRFVTIGSRTGGAQNFLTGRIYALVQIADELSVGQRQSLEAYLAAKAGVVLP